jgi:multidrug efflux pump subunit AcrB
MHRLVTFTLGQRVFMNLLFVLLIVIGAFTLLRMPVERYPNIEFGKMYINTFLPGASPEEVETLVTKEIEMALDDVEEVEFVSSSSYRERSSVVIKFDDDSDYRRRFDDVRLKILSVLDDLPAETETPVFNFLDVSDWFPAISVNVAGNHSNTTLSRVADELRVLLAQLDGVREVKVSGDYIREFHLLLSADKLRRFGMTVREVADAVRTAGITYPAGEVETSEGEFILRVDEQFTSKETLFDVIVRKDGDGSFVRLEDLADAGYFSYRDPFIMTSVNGKDCVTLQILKHPRSNALFIADEVRRLVNELKPFYEESGMELIVTQDSSLRIKDSIRVLGINLLLGTLLVCIIIWAFMGLRNAALTTIGIPFAFLVTMILMYVTGNSVNEVSLFAFVLVSGIIVDDAIVVVENIYRHLQNGKSRITAIIDGTSEVFLPVISATLTTIVAFLPMLIMTGMVGDFFAIIPKTIAFALAASIVECLFILPCHYYEFGPDRIRELPEKPFAAPCPDDTIESGCFNLDGEGQAMRFLRLIFHRLLLVTLKYRFLSLWFLGLLFLAGIAMFAASFQGKTNLLRIQFFPDNYSLYYVELTGKPGTPLQKVHAQIKEMAAAIMAAGDGQAESALGFAGYYISDDFSPKYGTSLGYVAVTLPTSDKRRFDDYPENDVVAHLDAVRQTVQPYVPEGFSFSIRPEKDGPPTGKDINIRILGNDTDNVLALADRIENYLRTEKDISPWLVDLGDDQGTASSVMRIKIDKERTAEFGLTVAEAAGLAATVIEGQIVGKMNLPEERIDIRMKTTTAADESIFALLDLAIVDLPEGALRLKDVSSPIFAEEPEYLNRFQGQRAVTLTADIAAGAPLTSPMVVAGVAELYASLRAEYPGAGLNFAGEHESTQKSFLSLAYAFVIAVVVIYLILAAQFQSYLQPLIIISAIIFALTGVIYGTALSRTLFTVNSFVAVIGVMGVVVNDSLVLVDFLNKTYRTGVGKRVALLRATHIRLRPIILTTLTTTLGLLPMALGIPEYSTIWGSMAMTFVTGLCTATLLTIFIVPVLWDILMKERGTVR